MDTDTKTWSKSYKGHQTDKTQTELKFRINSCKLELILVLTWAYSSFCEFSYNNWSKWTT